MGFGLTAVVYLYYPNTIVVIAVLLRVMTQTQHGG